MRSESPLRYRLIKVLVASAWLAGCASLLGLEDGNLHGSCAIPSDCAPGYGCLQGTCRDGCTTDEDCGAGSRCLVAIGATACIPVDEPCGSGCPEGTACVGNTCRSQCQSAEDCASGQTCGNGSCFGSDEEITPNSGGSGGNAGTGGTAPALGGESGSGGDAASAGAGGDGGSTIACAPLEPSCVGNSIANCNAKGDGYLGALTRCSSKQACVSGACEDHVCTPGASYCSGKNVMECSLDGLTANELDSCGAGTYCDAASATCKTGTCAADQPVCDGNRATTCNADGSGYLPGGTVCQANESCSSGACMTHVCVPGAKTCTGKSVTACAANGLSSSVEEACDDQVCVEEGGTASCQGDCAPPHARCSDSSNAVESCNAKGEYKASPECASNKTCVENGLQASCTGECGPGQARCADDSLRRFATRRANLAAASLALPTNRYA